MRDLALLLLHLIATLVKLLGRGGARSVVAESVLLKHQLLVLNRSRERAPRLRPMDRIVAGLCATCISPVPSVYSSVVDYAAIRTYSWCNPPTCSSSLTAPSAGA
jgi:hypothetical protein